MAHPQVLLRCSQVWEPLAPGPCPLRKRAEKFLKIEKGRAKRNRNKNILGKRGKTREKNIENSRVNSHNEIWLQLQLGHVPQALTEVTLCLLWKGSTTQRNYCLAKSKPEG